VTRHDPRTRPFPQPRTLLTTEHLSCPNDLRPLATEHATWSNAYESLQTGMETIVRSRRVGKSRIARHMETQGRGASIARIVQVVLKERGERLAELGQKCLELADLERSSFEELRRCAAMGAQRRDNSSSAVFKNISRDRDRLMAELQDLLLDEAYIQYKNHRAPAAPTSRATKQTSRRAYVPMKTED
jgi:hypothetical protein